MLAVDLAGSPRRPTGLAWLEEGKVDTATVKTDAEILRKAESLGGPVAIDAPLSLPDGRKSPEGPGPHFRECDLFLRRLGIKFFPVSLGPMRKLTARGMKLAEEIQALGLEVVEIYPGASLDLLGLPRKEVKKVTGFLNPLGAKPQNVHEADASMGLFTLLLWREGLAWWAEGKDGRILLPNPCLPTGIQVEGRFLRRLNRFVVEVEVNGKSTRAHLRDTGRLLQWLKPGARLFLERKRQGLPFRVKAGEGVWLDPALDAEMARLWLRRKGIVASRKGTRKGNSVFDLAWRGGIAEVKGASLKQGKTALFPDAPTERAIRQFSSMAGMGGEKWVVFVAHFQAEAVGLNPAWPEIGNALRRSGATTLGISTRLLGRAVGLELPGYWCGVEEIPVRL